jgi:hypothetical protein
LYIDTQDLERNLRTFEALMLGRDEIEAALGVTLDWERLPEARAKRIAAYAPFPVSISSGQDELERLKRWAVDTMIRFVQVFRPRIRRLA